MMSWGFEISSIRRPSIYFSSTCDGGGPAASPNNTFGYGRIDIQAAVNSVMQLSSVVSRKNHGGTPFDIALPLTGAAGVECRNGGGNQTLVFSFDGDCRQRRGQCE